jgi:hypothetical protein
LTAQASGGCGLGSVTNNGGSAPSACGGNKTVTFSVTSSCEGVKTCSATFTVTAAPAVTLTCASNIIIPACRTQQQVDAAYAAWLLTAQASGGCGLGTVTNNGGSAPSACGGSKTVTFTVTSSCEGVKTCSASFTVTGDNISPTLTCAPDKDAPCDGTISFDQPQASDNCGIPDVVIIVQDQIVGNVHTRVWRATDACGNTATCDQSITVPECGKGCTPGFWKNHTEIWDDMTGSDADPVAVAAGFTTSTSFFTFMGIAPGSCDLPNSLTMLEAVSLGGGQCKAIARQGVAALLGSAAFGADFAYPPGSNDFASLKALIASGFQNCSCPSSLIVALNDANNNEFDAEGNNICSALGKNSSRAAQLLAQQPEVPATPLTVTAYPNPFKDQVRFVINSQTSGQGSLEIYNMLGQKLQTVYNGAIVAGRAQIVEYKVAQSFNGSLIYVFKLGGKQVTGKLVTLER